MKNQFYYVRKEKLPVQVEGKEPEFRDFEDSFSLDMVIRSLEMENGERLVLLNDLHRRKERVPIRNKKGEVTGVKNEENTFQSEIYLSKEDGNRLKSLTSL